MSLPYSLRSSEAATTLLRLSSRELPLEHQLNANLASLHAKHPPTVVDRLPYVDSETIAEEDKQCPVCLATYGEDLGDGTTEEPTALPCNHVIGRKCLAKFHCNEVPDGHLDHGYEADSNTRCMLCRQTLFDRLFEDLATLGAFSGPHIASYKRARDISDKELLERFRATEVDYVTNYGWMFRAFKIVGPPLTPAEARKVTANHYGNDVYEAGQNLENSCLNLLRDWKQTGKEIWDPSLTEMAIMGAGKRLASIYKQCLLKDDELSKHKQWLMDFELLSQQMSREIPAAQSVHATILEFRQHLPASVLTSYIARCNEPLPPPPPAPLTPEELAIQQSKAGMWWVFTGELEVPSWQEWATLTVIALPIATLTMWAILCSLGTIVVDYTFYLTGGQGHAMAFAFIIWLALLFVMIEVVGTFAGYSGRSIRAVFGSVARESQEILHPLLRV